MTDVKVPVDEPARQGRAGLGDRVERAGERALGHRRRASAATRRSTGSITHRARAAARTKRSERAPAHRRPRHQGRDHALRRAARRSPTRCASGCNPHLSAAMKLMGTQLVQEYSETAMEMLGPYAALMWRRARAVRRTLGAAVPLRPLDDDRRRHERGAAQHRRAAHPRPAAPLSVARSATEDEVHHQAEHEQAARQLVVVEGERHVPQRPDAVAGRRRGGLRLASTPSAPRTSRGQRERDQQHARSRARRAPPAPTTIG